MIKTNKDLLFIIIVIGWLSSNILFFIFMGDHGLITSNMFWMVIMLVLVTLKRYDKDFALWLEKPFKKG